MLPSHQQILRVFGMPGAQVAAVLRAARQAGCPGLRLLERDGEYAVCVQVSAPTRTMAREYCEQWCAKLRPQFGDALYAEGEVSLAQAALDALLQKRCLVAAADETTGRLLGALLRPLAHSEAVFDFGHDSYLDAGKAARIVTPASILQKCPGDAVQAAAGRAAAAFSVAGADLAVLYMPAAVGQAPFVLVCDKRGAAAVPVDPQLNDAALGNWLLDLLRRRVLGLTLPEGGITFRPGRERPPLGVAEPMRRDVGDTTRFSTRRLRAVRPAGQPGSTAAVQAAGRDYEPMLDFDAAPAASGAAPLGAALDIDAPLPEPHPDSARLAAAAHAAAEQSWNAAPGGTIAFEDDDSDVTVAPAPAAPAGPAAAPAPNGFSAVPAAPSLLDRDTDPDFTLPTPDIPAPTGGAPLHSAQEMTDAANLLFAGGVDAPHGKARKGGQPPAAPDPAAAMLRSRSLAMVEKRERRQRRLVVFLLVFFVLALAAGAAGLWLYFRGHLGEEPSPRTYGTVRHDEQAAEYLAAAQQKRSGVLGYLDFPGQAGQLLYIDDAAAAAAADEDAPAPPALASANYLTAAVPGHTVIRFADGLQAFTDLETLQQNSGFTLYLPDEHYRCKVFAVYEVDPAETGATAFDPTAYGDLSNYYDYLAFTLGAQTRSLFDTSVQPGAGAHFLTLTADEPDGTRLCVTGRLIKATESPSLSASAVTEAAAPLRTAAQYAASGQAAPSLHSLLTEQLERHAADRSEVEAQNSGTGSDGENLDAMGDMIAGLQQQTDALLNLADEVMLAGLTDIAGQAGAAESEIGQGAEGTLPQQEAALPEAVVPLPTTAPSTDGADGGETGDGQNADAPDGEAGEAPDGESGEGGESPDGGENAEPPAQSAPDGETINVTMNGSAQSLDLVQCLAMVTQNELGPTAPLEACKAQCVATHCWILSQGGYPSVYGAAPGATALQAAQEVAHVLVSYNGGVAFTPYFASASTGTASSADVWGGDRPYLQPVDSPYDKDVATHWNTNGATSGTARFARATLLERFKEKLEIDLTDVDPNDWFHILSANEYGWVSRIQVGPDSGPNTSMRGTYFRETLLAGQSVDGRSLRSQCFTVAYDAETDCFLFDVYGYGHGCGMSQWGAIGYARNGWSYDQILLHYFPNTTLTTY